MTVEVTRLESGIRVVTDRIPFLETASVGAWFDVGARYESESENGISHLLEHMAFKGTRRRSARGLAEEIEAVGGQLNAYTSRDHTTYYARVMKGDVPLAVDILADILQYSTFDPVELDREKEVVLQEIGQAHDTPDDLVFDILQAAAFPDQPLGRTILGTVDRVRGFSADDIRGYMTSHYSPDRMVFVGAGNLDHHQIVSLVAEQFSALPGRPGSGAEESFQPAVYSGGVDIDERPLEQLHLAFGFPSLSYQDEDFFALQVFNAIVGGGMSSRLFQEVREERGLAYSVYSFSSSHADTGMFGIYAGTSPEHAGELVPVISGEMQALTRDVGDDELARAKAQLKVGLYMSLESSSARVEQLGRQMLIFGRPLPTEELTAKVDQVDKDDVRRIAARTLEGRLTLAAVGPQGNLAGHDEVSRLFSI